jgi:ABC-type bacteriocin/lantibiotic exporter with double-glycine peptidase domain
MSTILMSIGLFISSFAIAFYTGWLMTLVIFVCIPALGVSGAYHIKFLKQKDKELQKYYDEAGGKAE